MKQIMRASALFMLLSFILFLGACAPKAADPLSYQDRAAEVEATLSTPTGEFSFTASLPEMKDPASRRDADFALTSPETLSGVTVSVYSRTVKICSGGMEIPVSPDAAERWLSLAGLFSLDGARVTSVTDSGGRVVVGVGDAPERVLVSFDAGSDVPSKIETEDGRLSLLIRKYILKDDKDAGGTGDDGSH